MRINITINDDTIYEDVQDTIDSMLEYEEIEFPTRDDRYEFATEVTETIIDRYCNNPYYVPHYYDECLYLAKLYGYAKD